MSPSPEHGFKAGWLQAGMYRVRCTCGHTSVGFDSASAHEYHREHLAEMRVEREQVEQ